MQVKVFTRKLILSKESGGGVDPLTSSEGKIINWNSTSDRKWLTSHQHWAMNNQHCVLIRPLFNIPEQSN